MDMLSQGDRRHDVVSIVGMGGLGKTTLAKKIYRDDFIKKRFDCRTWVYVSQEFQTRELLLSILQSVTPSGTDDDDLSKMNCKKLAEELSKFLEDKRYLIVLDDVWSTQLWDEIQKAFPENMSGCRILVTSRKKEVALHASSTPPYFLPLLEEDDARELFSKKAFRGEGCPPELYSYARQIAMKCEGLPLTIVVVAGLLAKKGSSFRTWSQMAADISWYLDQNKGQCLDILAFSYEDLPPRLKPCFLYFEVFPEDFEVPVRQLIRLWVAEGFIEHDERRNVEDVAEDYLEELIDRSLLMVVKRRTDGGIKSCCIHDLLRDLSISEGVRENFLTVHTDQVFTRSSVIGTTVVATQPRRLSIHCSASTYVSSPHCDPSRVRSLLCFGGKDELDLQMFRSVNKSFRLLRVLDLGSTVVIGVPNQLKKLIHLRYLRMNAPRLREIPVCISSLPNLQTLDLRESEVVHLTNNFWEMQQLRHLFLSGDCDRPNHRMTGVKPMLNLQTFSTVNSSIPSIRDSNDNLVFPNLKKVGIMITDYVTKLECPKHIRSLKLISGCDLLFQKVDTNLLYLTKLTLKGTRLSSSTSAILEKFPSLQVLKLLANSLRDTTMEFKEGWFPKLHTLHLVELDVREWTVETGAIPSLRHIVIVKCLDLRKIPEQLVSTLRHVKVSWCSSMLERNIRTALRDNSNVKYEFQGYKTGGGSSWGN